MIAILFELSVHVEMFTFGRVFTQNTMNWG